jgi:hypothetical protein
LTDDREADADDEKEPDILDDAEIEADGLAVAGRSQHSSSAQPCSPQKMVFCKGLTVHPLMHVESSLMLHITRTWLTDVPYDWNSDLPAWDRSAWFRPPTQLMPLSMECASALLVVPAPPAAISSPVVDDVIQFRIPIVSFRPRSNTVAPSGIQVLPLSIDFDIDCMAPAVVSRPKLYQTLPPVHAIACACVA